MQNKLFYGDNLDVLRKYIKDETIDLCYIDPPFNSKRDYNQIYNNLGKEDKAQVHAFTDTWTWDTMAEDGLDEILFPKMYKYPKQTMELIKGLKNVLGKGSLLAYLVSMTLRITEIQRVLKPTGSFYLHCDPTTSHYLKLIVDSIFCSKGWHFKNEIIWSNESSSGYKTQVKSKYVRGHDIIFFYSNKNSKFSTQFLTLSESTVKRYDKTDDDGKKYKIYYENGVERRQYLEKSLGKKLSDTWTDLPSFQTVNASREWLGYPTQKPEALLERIIKASSNEGDIILDAYCGCGTSIAVAENLKRNWIGIDITYQSISIILKRFKEHFGNKALQKIELDGVPKDIESAVALANKKDDRTRKEFEKWSILTFTNNQAIVNDKKGGDRGIDGRAFILDKNENGEDITKEILLSVKSNKILSTDKIRELFGTVEREDAAIGYFITLYPMENLVKESKLYGRYENKFNGQTYPKIEVININEILEGKRMNLPTSLEVLKKAVLKARKNQDNLGFDE